MYTKPLERLGARGGALRDVTEPFYVASCVTIY